jgi:polysaccharide biosynthesis protein PslG
MHGNARALQRAGAMLLLIMLVPLIAACGEMPPASATTQSPVPTTPVVASEPEATATPVVATEVPTEEPAVTDIPAPTPTDAPTETPEPATAVPTVEPTESPEMAVRPAFGVVAHLYYTDRERVLQLAENAGFEWIRQQVPWKDTEKSDRTFGWDELDKVVESVHARDKKLLLSVTKAPDFLTGRPDDNGLPLDPKDFGRFVGAIAERYQGKVHAIEVWNEQNLAHENGGRVVPEDAARYVELLKEGYTAIKAVDPSIIVVAGALSSTGVTKEDEAVDDIEYLTNMYTYNDGEIRDYFDVQGFHPASAANPPDTKYPEDPGNAPGWNDHPTHYFRHIENVRQVMVDAGLADKKIWITEMGWATENNSPGYEYGNFVSLEQQADYLEGALFRTMFQYSEWVGAAFIWNLNFAVLWQEQGNPLHEQASFGLLNPDWSPRPSYTRVQGFINAVKSDDQP